jgi:Zn-dependent protease with chaperone function
LVLLVAEGYAYLIGTIAVFGAVVAILAWGLLAREPVVGLLALFLGAPTVLLTGAALRSLVFSAPEPNGVRLTSAAAPAMIRMVEEMRREVGCRTLDAVLVVSTCNASAFQAGGRWRQRNVLLIGYPLLVVLSPDQLKAVVAHELAHFANGDSRLAGLVYRTRASWFRLVQVLDERGTTPIFIRWVLSAYLPRLQAGSAEVARAHEYFADRTAASVSGPRAAAEALCTNAVMGELLETKFWPSVAETAGIADAPPRPFTSLGAATLLDNTAANGAVLEGLLAAPTHRYDTHPSLSERLSALRETPHAPVAPKRTAGETLLGPELTSIARQLDEEWLQKHGAAWRERDAAVRHAMARLAQLDGKQAITGEQLVERGRVLEELKRASEALDAYQAALDRAPNNAEAALGAGRLLLAGGAAAGVDLVTRSMELDVRLVPAACEILVDYSTSQRRFAEAERYRARWARSTIRARLVEGHQPAPALSPG